MAIKFLFHIALIIGVLLITFFSPVFGQSHKQLNEKINTLIKEQKLSGAVWTVVNGDGEITTDAYGYKNLTTKDKLEPTDKILVGSIAKTVIATGFLRMATLGIINLDDPIRKYLPKLPLNNKWEDVNPVTIRHLLDHTSGLADVKLWQVFSTTAQSDTPLEFAYNQSPELLMVQAKPGSIHSYSNIGYSILGKIIEVISKKSFEQYLKEELLLPLGMVNSSFFYISQKDDKQLAFGHFENGQHIYAMPMYLRPAGQFSSTAHDMGLFLTFMMSDGKIDGQQFIHKELLSEVGNHLTTDAFKNGVPFGEALGAYKRDRYGVIGIAKNGNTLGFRSMLYMFPEYQKAFFIAFNMDSETSKYDLFNEVLTAHLQLPVMNFKTKGNPIDEALKTWEGYYQPSIIKVKPFKFLDLVFNFTKVSVSNNEAILSPFQGVKKILNYQSNNLFSMKDRIEISHSFYKDSEGNYFITDGINTLQKTNGFKILAGWLSLLLGVIGMLYFLITGIITAIKTKTQFFTSAVFPVFAVLVFLVVAIFLMASQPIIRLGDLNFANILLANTTLLLPISSIITCTIILKRQRYFLSSTTFWASLLVFQCSFLLAINDLVPMVLWK